MTADIYAAPDTLTEEVPAVRMARNSERDAYTRAVEVRRDVRALRSVNARFDGVDRSLTGDPGPGLEHTQLTAGVMLAVFGVGFSVAFAAVWVMG